MSAKERERLEKNHKWTYKLFKQSDVDRLVTDSISSDDDADGRRATNVSNAPSTLRTRFEGTEHSDYKGFGEGMNSILRIECSIYPSQ